MSRNFELLQKIGKEQGVFQPEEVLMTHDVPETLVEAAVLPQTPVLNIGAKELEEVTKLVQRLFLLPGVESPRSVVFMGTEPGNGCSWMCARTAEVLASQVTGTVCLVDANLREPAQHEMFGVSNYQGLSDSLRFTEPIAHYVQRLSRPNLYLVSCGSTGENWQGLMSSDRMRLRLAELRNEFDYVLIDTAAMSVCSDGVALGCAADGVVLVLKANSSRREWARKAVHELQTARARVLGAVLNQRTFPIPESIYKKL
ncbi:MAG: CpsD/CapB family tyrosine-protein kinase [Acidobacteriia bacterium]|nr:CpsD/CapB family tyrosine-protein kinase [Terriglobia bacterium]